MRSSTASRSGSRTRSGESTASCMTCRTSPPRRSSGSSPLPQGNLFLIGPLREYHARLRRRQRGPVDAPRVAGPGGPPGRDGECRGRHAGVGGGGAGRGRVVRGGPPRRGGGGEEGAGRGGAGLLRRPPPRDLR